MKKILLSGLALALTLSLAACGGGDDEDENKITTVTGVPVETKPAAAESGAGSESKPAVEVEGLDPRHQKLVGTTWNIGEFRVEFQTDEKVLLSGGPITSIAPAGMPASYSFQDGQLELEAMGQQYNGTWDGETLQVTGEFQ